MKSTLARTKEEYLELEEILSNHCDLVACFNNIIKLEKCRPQQKWLLTEEGRKKFSTCIDEQIEAYLNYYNNRYQQIIDQFWEEKRK